MEELVGILNVAFGHAAFRPGQAEIVSHVADGGDALVLLPTGGGKSICYQVPGLARRGMAVVVSPLLSLMRDQVDALSARGVSAACLDSTVTGYDRANLMADAAAGRVKFLYVTPETLVSRRFVEFLDCCEIALFAIDEAHCASEWGNDFRPDYGRLGFLGERYRGVPRVAVTATADPATRADILAKLDLSRAKVFSAPVDRANISIHAERRQPAAAHKARLEAILRAHEGQSGIVYCLGRAGVEKTADWIASLGISALPYHAGMDMLDRDHNQEAFLSGEVQVLVGTNAFGMGIDKADIRFVIHADMPASPEAYMQETGRAGRDGAPAAAYMFYGDADVAMRRRMAKKGSGGAVSKRTDLAKLDAIMGICETSGCRRAALLRYFGETPSGRCAGCDGCAVGVGIGGDGELAALLSHVEAAGGKADAEGVLARVMENPAGFGHGRDKWASVIRQAVAAGFLSVDLTDMARIRPGQATGAFKLSAAAPLKAGKAPRSRQAKASSGMATARSGEASPRRSRKRDDAPPLLRALRSARDRIARREKVKKFFVIHDASLKEMAELRPSNAAQLLEIKGVGQEKVRRYGGDFLGVIAQHA